MKQVYMTNIGSRIILPIIALIFINISVLSAQSVNIVYTNTTLTGCNVFNPPVLVGTKMHNSWAGAVTYVAGSGLRLNTTPTGPTVGGTAFFISYNFIPGNLYSISVTTSGGNNQIKLNTSVVPNLSNYVSSNTAACNGTDPFVNGYVTSGYSKFTTTVAPTTTTYNITAFQVPGSQPYTNLLVWASSGNPSLSLDGFYIRSIVITQVNASFPVSPTTANITCGTALAQTFSAANPNNIPNIVSYTWNLGAVPNGWVYNGSAAPASVTTPTNSIALTAPAGGTLPKPLSLVVNIAGSTSVSGANGVTPALNAFAISGTLPYLCAASGVYSIANLTYSGATVNWSAVPAGAINFSCTTCPSTTITRNYSTTVALTATITNGCSTSPVTLNTNLTVGAPDVGFTYSKNGACNGSTQSWFLSVLANRTTNVHWTVTSLGNGSSIYLTNPNSNATYANVIGGGGITVTYNDLCGVANQNGASVYSTCGGGHFMFSVSPNPASSTVTVSSIMEKENTTSLNNANTSNVGSTKQPIDQIKILDKSGGVVKVASFSAGTSIAQINVSGLLPGIYIIEIHSGKEVVRDKIIVQK